MLSASPFLLTQNPSHTHHPSLTLLTSGGDSAETYLIMSQPVSAVVVDKLCPATPPPPPHTHTYWMSRLSHTHHSPLTLLTPDGTLVRHTQPHRQSSSSLADPSLLIFTPSHTHHHPPALTTILSHFPLPGGTPVRPSLPKSCRTGSLSPHHQPLLRSHSPSLFYPKGGAPSHSPSHTYYLLRSPPSFHTTDGTPVRHT